MRGDFSISLHFSRNDTGSNFNNAVAPEGGVLSEDIGPYELSFEGTPLGGAIIRDQESRKRSRERASAAKLDWKS